jgi:cyclopropane-fatty-acyl-phospholipid synthase
VIALTLSEAQFQFASRLASETQLGRGSVVFLLEDYRKVCGKFDKVVSIEMFEAVGFDHYDEFFSTCDRLLNRDGTLLLQLITLPDQELRAYRKRVDWIQTYIFPGSELASVAEIHRAVARSTRMFLVNMENFGWHYARTLARWRERFLEKIEAVEGLGFDARFQRMWDFYLAWCQGAFLERYINVAQMLLSKIASQQPLAGDPLPEPNPMVRRASL